jgi:predicted nuclease of predicted toxin-antitoxin system
MPIPLYFDECVNQTICSELKLRGVTVLTAQEDGREATDDNEILIRATELNYLLVTSDKDFFTIANTQLQQSSYFTGVIFLRAQLSVGYAVESLEIYAKAGNLEDFANKVTFL